MHQRNHFTMSLQNQSSKTGSHKLERLQNYSIYKTAQSRKLYSHNSRILFTPNTGDVVHASETNWVMNIKIFSIIRSYLTKEIMPINFRYINILLLINS